MTVTHLSSFQLNSQCQDIAVRIVTTLLYRKSRVTFQAWAKNIFFFANISRPSLESTKHVQYLRRSFAENRVAGALCLALQSIIENKNKQFYTSVPSTSLDVLDRDK
jgi:hypothetical protein